MIKPGMFISDRYEIIDKVGSGGMADVYKAKCHRLNRYVAIKILRSEYSNDKSFVAKFRAEAQSVAGLSHPNIVNVYDVGEDNGLYYIVMELVEGITLKKFIERKGRLEVKEAVGIAIQIALGMEAAHDAHIIHRDIKPQNIIISRDGKVKVTDFGIAKAATSNTLTSNAMGSVHYLSPEQARGGYSDERSDIYSLGVTMYEMLCGKVPFAGDNTVSVALLHIQGEAVPVREINPEVPVSVDKIVQKCMQKKPERRYLSASELIADLKRSIANPGGDFVKLASNVVPDSPTISLSADDVRDINKARVGQQSANHGEETHTAPVYQGDTGRKKRQNPKNAVLEDEEDLDSVDSKVEKVLLGVTISFAIILGIVILYLVVRFFGLFGGRDNEQTTTQPSVTTEASSTEPTSEDATDKKDQLVKVESVLKLTKEDAERTLKLISEDFDIIYAPEEYSDEIEIDRVLAQYPEPGTKIASNSTITLTLSAGPEPVALRNVRNLEVNYAKTQLEEEDGLKVRVVYEYSNELEKDRVIRTEPEEGSLMKKGDTVTLIVSDGPSETTTIVPKLTGTGSTEETAKEKLEAQGLYLGEVKREYSAKPEGEVIAQGTSAGESVATGSSVSITVSKGEEPTKENTTEPTQEETTEPPIQEIPVYAGTVTITDNPFTDPADTGEIYLELEQNGEQTMLYNKTLGYSNFPLTLTFNSDDNPAITEGSGTIRMYVNDVLYSDNQWYISFQEQ
ncbi:MAG: Stk1 family PASTA domain-containing Ser/Thr kinase [Lachnospiraceae bacterium]|nr:Stk1 family PASTA domain-containing Ser/Thr kinase [Lachnospiraceae bacterium]